MILSKLRGTTRHSKKNEVEKMEEEIVDKVKELTEKLDKGVEEILTSDRFKEYLKQMSKFHNYSFNKTNILSLNNIYI